MAKKSDGDFEVLLGNTQLLSLFVIVVILLGVFFTMGYILGRHSGAASADAIATKEPAVQMPPRAAPSESPAPSSKAESTPAERASEPAAAPTAPATAPVGSMAPASEARAKRAAREPAPPAAPSAPAAGQTFLQVVATNRSDAEGVAGVLAKKGFSTMVAPSPKAGVFRVMVGPLADAEAVSKTRTRLEKAGFATPVLQRY
jgi:cell division protein FtsN